MLDTTTMTWECVYYGHPELVVPTGSVATLMHNKLVMLNSAAGSPKLDLAMSLDFMGIRDGLDFTTKMKQDAVSLLERLEGWCDKQAHGMELARNLEVLSKNFDNLLKVCTAHLPVYAYC